MIDAIFSSLVNFPNGTQVPKNKEIGHCDFDPRRKIPSERSQIVKRKLPDKKLSEVTGNGASSEKFYKGRSQEKAHLPRLEFFLLPSPLDRARSVLTSRAMDSGAGHCDPAVWIFPNRDFHRFFATKPVRSETNFALKVPA
jgi:hypothetical protein